MIAAASGLVAALAIIGAATARRPRARRPLAPASAPAGSPPVPLTGPASRRWTVAVVLVLTAVLTAPIIAIVVGVAGAGWSRRRRVHLRRRAGRSVIDALPDAVDLLLLCVSAGESLALAHPRVAERVPGQLGCALRHAAIESDAGRSRADALVDALTPIGDRSPALAHALADHLRYGAAMVPSLERLGAELRLDRRRRAEQDARRVPVRLLLPLVACVLPAFALLTVVPLLAASVQSLPS